VIYVGASLVFLLLVVASRPAGRVVALGSAVVLMTVVISVLGMLDQPFGIGGVCSRTRCVRRSSSC
jgi:hypothetical protein